MRPFLQECRELIGIGIRVEHLLLQEKLSVPGHGGLLEEGDPEGGQGLDDGVVFEKSLDFGKRFL